MLTRLVLLTFSRAQRLTNAKEFEQVFRRADINLSSGPLRIRARKNKLSTSRIGIVVPKRGNQLAVRRNRIKRIIREQFRLSGANLPDLDIVVQVFSAIEDRHLVRDLNKLFGQLEQGHFKNRSNTKFDAKGEGTKK